MPGRRSVPRKRHGIRAVIKRRTRNEVSRPADKGAVAAASLSAAQKLLTPGTLAATISDNNSVILKTVRGCHIAKKNGPSQRGHPSCCVSQITCRGGGDDDGGDDDGEDASPERLELRRQSQLWRPKRKQIFS